MNTKEKNDEEKILTIIIVIGIILVIIGISQMLKKMTYKETNGTCTHSSSYTSTTSDDREQTFYKWYYSYQVGGNEYEVVLSSQKWKTPDKRQETVLYNPSNPKKAVLKRDYTDTIMFVVGIMFIGIAYVFKKDLFHNNHRKNVGVYTDVKNNELRAFGLVWLGVSFLILYIIFLADGLDISILLKHDIAPTIIMLILIGVGVFMVVKSYSMENNYTSFNYKVENTTLKQNAVKFDNSYDHLDNDILKYNAGDSDNNNNQRIIYNDLGDNVKNNNSDEEKKDFNYNGYKYDEPKIQSSRIQNIDHDKIEGAVNKLMAIQSIVGGAIWCTLILIFLIIPELTNYRRNSSIFALLFGFAFIVFGIIIIVLGVAKLRNKK